MSDIFITQYFFEEGILLAELLEEKEGWIKAKIKHPHFTEWYFHGEGQWFRTEKEAVEHCRKMTKKRINKLKEKLRDLKLVKQALDEHLLGLEEKENNEKQTV